MKNENFFISAIDSISNNGFIFLTACEFYFIYKKFVCFSTQYSKNRGFQFLIHLIVELIRIMKPAK